MPVTQLYAYFDHAAVAPLPNPARQAIHDYADSSAANGDASWPHWAQKLEHLRQASAQMINASAEEIALVPNTTVGIQLVAQGMPWEPGDNVVVPTNEFPSNLLPWRALESQGVEVRELKVPKNGIIDVEKLDQVTDEKTRIVAMSWVGYATGFRINVREMADVAHAAGAYFMLDAIQGLGAFPLDVVESKVDFLAADGHKWMLGPEGAGIFYCRSELLEYLKPVGIGWNSLSQGAFDGLPHIVKTTAARYEGGTLNMPGFHGLLESLQLLMECGLNTPIDAPAIEASILDQVAYLESGLRAAGFQPLLAPERANRSGIVGVTWPEAEKDSDLFARARLHLLSQKIVTSVRAKRLRISLHAYNNQSEIDRLTDELQVFREQ